MTPAQAQANRAVKFSGFLHALGEPTTAQKRLLQAGEEARRLNERKDAV